MVPRMLPARPIHRSLQMEDVEACRETHGVRRGVEVRSGGKELRTVFVEPCEGDHVLVEEVGWDSECVMIGC